MNRTGRSVRARASLASSSTPRGKASDVRAQSELWLESQGQIDFYDDPRLIGSAVGAIAERFSATVG